MSIVVYYLSGSAPRCQIFDDDEREKSIAKCESLINQGYTHVTSTQQTFVQVGASDPGGAVVDGKLPNGEDYAWSKSHRAGAKQQKEVIKK